jgi:hypothetical protein
MKKPLHEPSVCYGDARFNMGEAAHENAQRH